MASLHLSFLGRPAFALDDRPVALTSGKAVALLAYLAARRVPQSRDHLLDLLWPASSPDAARKNLRNVLWTLRKLMGDDALTAGDDHLAIAPPAWIDLAEFEKAADSPSPAAIELYRGPFLDGVRVLDAPDFEIWLTGERERLARLFLRATATQLHAQRVARNWQGVIDLANRALAQDNLQEPMHRALMEAHARLGQRAEALRQYDALKTTLARELGVEPLAETEALRQAIQRGEVGPVSAPAPPTPLLFKRQPAASEPYAPAFIGRQPELSALDDALRAAAGQARVAALIGEMGIGKTRLWREWSERQIESGVVAIEARCIETAQDLPLLPLADMLRRRACFQHLFTPGSPVAPIWLAEIARLLPDIRHSLPDLPPPAVLPPDEERRRLFEALIQCLLAVSTAAGASDGADGAVGVAETLMLFVDDLHWADHATLDWINYVTHRLREHPLLIVLAYRAEDSGAGLASLVAGWGRQGLLHKIALAQLNQEETVALLTEALPVRDADEALRQRIQAQSRGNPYFLIELCKIAPDEVPIALSELIRARLARLPGPAQQVLQSAAVLDPDFDLVLLRRASGRDEQETLDALDALLGAAVLVERSGGRGDEYAFAHPLVATIVRAGLSGARRAFLNRRAAEAIVATHAGRLPPVAGRLAAHYAEAGDLAQAATYAESAGDHALSLAAFDEAVAFFQRALDIEPTPARRMGLGRALMWRGLFEDARAAYQAALDEYKTVRDWQGLARACLGLAETYLPVGKGDEIVRWVKTALGYLDVKADPASHAQARFLLGAGLPLAGASLADAETHLAEAARLAAENDLADVAARSRFEQGNLLTQRGNLEQAVAAFEDSVTLSLAARNQFQEVLGHNNAAYNAVLLGRLDLARAHIERALSLANAYALDLPRQWLYSTRGELALAERRWDEAQTWLERGLAESERANNVKQVAGFRANLGLVARGRGDSAAALALLESARRDALQANAVHLAIQANLWLAELHLDLGEREAAHEVLGQAGAQLASGERKWLQAQADRLHATLRAHESSTDDADDTDG